MLQTRLNLRFPKRLFRDAFCARTVFLSRFVSLGTLLFGAFLFSAQVSAFDALTPLETAVLAVKSDADSMRVAEFYMKARGIPSQNLILLEKNYPEDLPRDVWENEVRPQIAQRLAERPSIRCLVCAWGLPLRIDAPNDEVRRNERLAFFTAQEAAFVEKIRTIILSLLETVPDDASRAQAQNLPNIEGMEPAQIAQLLAELLKNAKERVSRLSEEEQKEANKNLDKILLPTLGLQGVQNAMVLSLQTKNVQLKPEAILKILKTVRAFEALIVEISFEKDSPERDKKLIQAVMILNGNLPALQLARGMKAQLERNEGRSSFDSELSLIYEPERYTLIGWIPNMYAYSNNLPPRINIQIKPNAPVPAPAGLLEHPDAPASDDVTDALPTPNDDGTTLAPPPLEVSDAPKLDTEDASAEEPKEEISMSVERQTVPDASVAASEDGFRVPAPKRRVLLVARLEGPSVETVLKRIEESVEVEKKGLEGAVYLDARTSRPMQAAVGSYAKMEQSLNDLAIRLERCTDLDVHLDTAEPLFTKDAASAPCALYCGWYSVRNFQDIFTFQPGAVAYHVASFEAESLRTGPGWCPNLIEHGAAATCGPTFEPYLAAFPEPDEFYSLVLTGKFTMIECFYMAKPFNSWAMTYVGDPLYCPYRVNPKLRIEDLPNKLQRFLGRQP